jgi:hypothetical protein
MLSVWRRRRRRKLLPRFTRPIVRPFPSTPTSPRRARSACFHVRSSRNAFGIATIVSDRERLSEDAQRGLTLRDFALRIEGGSKRALEGVDDVARCGCRLRFGHAGSLMWRPVPKTRTNSARYLCVQPSVPVCTSIAPFIDAYEALAASVVHRAIVRRVRRSCWRPLRAPAQAIRRDRRFIACASTTERSPISHARRSAPIAPGLSAPDRTHLHVSGSSRRNLSRESDVLLGEYVTTIRFARRSTRSTTSSVDRRSSRSS